MNGSMELQNKEEVKNRYAMSGGKCWTVCWENTTYEVRVLPTMEEAQKCWNGWARNKILIKRHGSVGMAVRVTRF